MRPVTKSLQEYARGIAGGLLFSLPMLYTMEVWWTGFTVSAGGLLIYMVVTFLLLIGYNRFAGMRRDASYKEILVDSVEEMGLGFIISFSTLWLLGQIQLTEMDHREITGKVIIEAMTIAVGISIGTAQLGEGDKERGGEKDTGVEGDEDRSSLGSQVVIAICGAIIIGANLAPTEEISIIALDISQLQAVLLIILSLVLTALIMYYIDFANAQEVTGQAKVRKILTGTFLSYFIALAAAVFMLWFFNHFDGNHLLTNLRTVIVLGVATSLGASAGRLLLLGND